LAEGLLLRPAGFFRKRLVLVAEWATHMGDGGFSFGTN